MTAIFRFEYVLIAVGKNSLTFRKDRYPEWNRGTCGRIQLRAKPELIARIAKRVGEPFKDIVLHDATKASDGRVYIEDVVEFDIHQNKEVPKEGDENAG